MLMKDIFSQFMSVLASQKNGSLGPLARLAVIKSQPPQMDFQAVIKAAASAAEKIQEKLPFGMPYIGIQ